MNHQPSAKSIGGHRFKEYGLKIAILSLYKELFRIYRFPITANITLGFFCVFCGHIMAQGDTHKYFYDKIIRSLVFTAKGVTKASISLYTQEVTGSSPVSPTTVNPE